MRNRTIALITYDHNGVTLVNKSGYKTGLLTIIAAIVLSVTEGKFSASLVQIRSQIKLAQYN